MQAIVTVRFFLDSVPDACVLAAFLCGRLVELARGRLARDAHATSLLAIETLAALARVQGVGHEQLTVRHLAAIPVRARGRGLWLGLPWNRS